MPCVLAVTRFKSLSHRLDVDLSVLRANFTGWRRGPDYSSTYGLPIHAFVHTPQLDLFNRQEVIQIIIGHALSYFKSDQVTYYRILKTSRFNTRTAGI
jgi:hypothetical protein